MMKRSAVLLSILIGVCVPYEDVQAQYSMDQAGDARANAKGNGSCGGEIVVDCKSHKATIGSQKPEELGLGTGTVNCGAGGATKEGTGRVGKQHKGEIVQCGARIEGIAGMGDSGGGKVLHTNKPGQPCDDKRSQGSDPQGQDVTKGCIVFNPTLLDHIMQKCEGASLTIKNAGGKGAGGFQAKGSGEASDKDMEAAGKAAKGAK